MFKTESSPAELRPEFAWLLGTETPPTGSALSQDEFEAAGRVALQCWQVLPVTVARLLQWAGPRFEEHPLTAAIRDLVLSAKTLTRVQVLLCKRLTRELDRNDIPYTLLKGSAMRLVGYPTLDSRCSMDVDIGVPFRFLGAVDGILRNLGVVPASLNPDGRHFHRLDPVMRRAVEASHYELACRVRRQVIRDLSPNVAAAIRRSLDRLHPWHVTENGEIGCYVTFDVHHGICLDIEVDGLVDSSQTHRSDNYEAKVPPPHWLAFHLIFKIYWEGVHNYGKGLYQYADLVRLAPHLTGDSAMALLELLSEYNLEAAGFYTLRRLETEFGVTLSQELKIFVELAGVPSPDYYPLDLNDYGDMWNKIWNSR